MSKRITGCPKIEPISEATKAYGRMTTRVQVAAAVWTLWDRLREERDLDQQWLADRMGKDKSWASRLLKGPGNWTLDTVGELLEAMGARLTLVEASTYDEIAQGKAAKSSRQAGARFIVKIEAEIVIDDSDGLDLQEVGWGPSSHEARLHRLALPLEEREDAA